jgi:hypothetical protein
MHFPTTIIDDFYYNVDEIREYALGLEYYKPTHEGTYPGLRSQLISEVNPQLHQLGCAKLLATFFDYETTEVSWEVKSFFQYIPPYDQDASSAYNMGWIHQDHESSLTVVLYLSPDASPDSGTSIYKKLSEDNSNQIERLKFYSDGDSTGYIDSIMKHRSNYVETVSVKNYYNRAILFDGAQYHAASNLHGGKEPRLTQVFFFNNITSSGRPPLMRVGGVNE